MSKKLFAVRQASSKAKNTSPTFPCKQSAKAHRKAINPVGTDAEGKEFERMDYVVTYGPDHHRYVA